MTLPSSGAISLSDIQTEFGGTTPIGISEYYAGGTYVASGTSGTNGSVPSSGQISLWNFYGTSAFSYWQTIYGNAYNTIGPTTISSNSSSSIFMAGSVYSGYKTLNGTSTSKYSNVSGTLTWQRSLSGQWVCNGVAADSSNNVYTIVNTSTGYTSYGLLLKYNTGGTLQWQRKISYTNWGISGSAPIGVITDSSAGNVFVFVEMFPSNSANTIPVLLKYNSSGTIQWQRKLSIASSQEHAKCISRDPSDNVYVIISTSTYCHAVKYNSSGTIQWQRKLSGSGNVIGYGITTDSTSNTYVCGSETVTVTGTVDAFIAKYNTTGTIQWQRRLGKASSGCSGLAITTDAFDNVYMTGQFTSGSGVVGSYIAKYNSSGTLQWQLDAYTTGPTTPTLKFTSVTVSAGILYVGGEIGCDATNNNYGRTGNMTDSIIINMPLSSGTPTKTFTAVNGATTEVTNIITGTLTDSSLSLTDAAGGLTDAAGGLTDAAGAETDGAGVLSSQTV